MCQVIYGASSFVFVPFQLPFLANVLTHAPPTAYDDKGRCRKFKGIEPPKSDEQDNFKAKLLKRSETAMDDVVTNIKTVAAGGTVDMDAMRRRFKTLPLTESVAPNQQTIDEEAPQAIGASSA